MSSPYAGRSGRSGGSAYAGRSRYGGSAYAGRSGATSAPTAELSHHHGILGHVLKVLAKTGTNLKDVAYHTPGGLYALNKASAHDVERVFGHIPGASGSKKHGAGGYQLPGVAKGTVEQIATDLRHPLRNPGYTLLDVLPVANAAGKVAEAGRVAKAGGTAGDVVRAATRRPVYESRTLRRGGVEVKVGSSQSALGAVSQRLADKAIHAGAEAHPGGVADKLLTRKIGKAVAAEARTIQDTHKAAGAALIAMGRKLKPAEQKALQVVAEEAPLEKRITAASARVTGAKTPKLRRRHQAELDLLHQAQAHLTEKSGKPVFAGPHAAKLGKTLATMREVATSREDLLKSFGQLTDEAIQGRKSKAARVSIGEPLEEGTLRLDQSGKPLAIEHTHERILNGRLASIERDYQKLVESAMGGKPGDYKNVTAIQNGRLKGVHPTVREQLLSDAEKTITETMRRNPEHPTVQAWQKKLAEADAIRHELARRADVSLGFEKPLPTADAEPLFQASRKAIRIPDVATRRGTRALSRPGGVGTQGTIGHLKAPGSVTHEYTGALRENAVRRQDTTALVGESALESAKYAGLKHVHELVRKAATPEPGSPSDVAVRLDKLKSHKRMPLEVRKFIDSPDEFFKTATPAEHASVFEGVRQRLFINPKTLDAADAAEFRKLNAEGKIGWVPRRLLGDLAKPHIPYSGKAVRGVDAINNASRFAILYLKPAYALPNVLGNAALNVLQQGFAAVPNLARAAKLNDKLGPGLTARIDTLMGEGFARAISAHGQGVGSAVVDKAASIWSRGVDTPFRRSSFLYEARRLGFDTTEKLGSLLTDPAHQARLVEVTQRANREIIDYANLTPTEREVVRRVVFFYPWVKGSSVYAGRFLREHPVKAAVAGQVGQVGKRNDPAAPSYLEGVFPIGGRLVNPSSAAILQTPAQVGQALAGLAGGDVGQVGELSNFLSPASALALAAVTKRDRQGYQYPNDANVGEIAFDQLVKNVPQYTLGQRISDALHGKGQDRLYPPNILDAILQYTVGGVAPRKYNKAKLAELATAEKKRYVP